MSEAVETVAPLWPNGKKLKIIGGTGAFGVGKSIFGLGINPASTCCFDCEKSCEDYEGLGFTRVDLPELLHKKYQKRYTERQKYDLFAALIDRVPAGKFSVLMIDTLDELEAGLVDSIKARYADFGFKTAEKWESTGGIFWKAVNSELERVLLDAAARCQTLYFTTHLRKVWKWGKPTDDTEPRGKEVLMKLASLYLQFESNGAGRPPSARVLKGRTSDPKLVNGVVQVNAFLPERIPVATAQTIRDYILNPPDFGNLKEEELVKQKELTEQDRILLNAKLAEDQRIAAEATATAEAAKERTEALKARVLQEISAKEARRQQAAQETAPKEDPKEQPQEATETRDVDGFMDDVRKLNMETKVLDAIVSTLSKRGVEAAADATAPALLTDKEFDQFRARVNTLLAEKGAA